MGILDKILKKDKGVAASVATAASDKVKVQAEEKKREEKGDNKRNFVEGLVSTKDIIAPSSIEVDFDHVRVDNRYYRTMFAAGYPRFVGINWLSPLINFDASLMISMLIYPTDGKEILDDLRRKIAEMEAEISTDIQRGKVVNPATQAKLEDALTLQADLVKGEERFFQFGLYVTAMAENVEELNRISKNLESALGALMIITKRATLQMEEGFLTTLPVCQDKLKITRNMDTTSLASTFPFVSSDLSDDKGIMYGLNEHNGSLVIFDRFSMPNYNSVVFATAGAGKSYLIKLEALRSLMLGTEIIVIDPENEYKNLCEAVGGQYIAFGFDEASKINPFDLSLVEGEKGNALNSKILALHSLFKTMIGEMDPIEESIVDRSIVDAYKMKGITPDPESQNKEVPLLEDLYKSLIGREEPKAQNLAARFEKYIKGSFAGILNQKTTVNLTNKFVVFGIRNLEEALRPVAMHIILDYVWTIVKKELKRRILVVDEAWYLMQFADSAAFLRGIVKRGRKYYLGVTTITQDVDDFLQTPYGKEIVTNSAIQVLMKQHSAAIDQVGEVFYLSEGEKQLLMAADKGEGIFFAGQNHVAIRVIASEEEHQLITSNPEEVLRMKQEGKIPVEEMKAEEGLIPELAENEEDEDEEKELLKAAAPQPSPIPASPIQGVAVTDTGQKVTIPIPEEKTETVPPVEVKETTAVVKETALAEEKAPVLASEEGKKEERVVWKAEVVGQDQKQEEAGGVEADLERKIAEMEARAKEEVEAHEKVKAEENKKKEEEKKLSGTLGSFGTLPKYQDLFKAKLPPLPPLPKFESNLSDFKPPAGGGQTKTVGVVAAMADKKPIFIKAEEKVPQPPQLKKAQAIKTESSETGKKAGSYDDLFGNGIV